MGILTSCALFVAMLANLILLPSLILSLDKALIGKAFVKEPLLVIMDEEEDIDLSELEIRREGDNASSILRD